MHTLMTCSLSTRHGRCDRLMCSQAVGWEVELTADIYGWTHRGPLDMMEVQAAVQWFATRRRVGIARAMSAWARDVPGAEDA